mmetsp:Transcript_17435/g.36118  ORF Transcript_17435/g.36118 Transcript_17435/m.36118 type:complete len:116 (-) Transcript_17435:771-1118(-)
MMPTSKPSDDFPSQNLHQYIRVDRSRMPRLHPMLRAAATSSTSNATNDSSPKRTRETRNLVRQQHRRQQELLQLLDECLDMLDHSVSSNTIDHENEQEDDEMMIMEEHQDENASS